MAGERETHIAKVVGCEDRVGRNGGKYLAVILQLIPSPTRLETKHGNKLLGLLQVVLIQTTIPRLQIKIQGLVCGTNIRHISFFLPSRLSIAG